jgi:hypothetical protein
MAGFVTSCHQGRYTAEVDEFGRSFIRRKIINLFLNLLGEQTSSEDKHD